MSPPCRASWRCLDVPMSPASIQALKPGKNLIAVRCRQNSGARFIDDGIVDKAD